MTGLVISGKIHRSSPINLPGYISVSLEAKPNSICLMFRHGLFVYFLPGDPKWYSKSIPVSRAPYIVLFRSEFDVSAPLLGRFQPPNKFIPLLKVSESSLSPLLDHRRLLATSTERGYFAVDQQDNARFYPIASVIDRRPTIRIDTIPIGRFEASSLYSRERLHSLLSAVPDCLIPCLEQRRLYATDHYYIVQNSNESVEAFFDRRSYPTDLFHVRARSWIYESQGNDDLVAPVYELRDCAADRFGLDLSHLLQSPVFGPVYTSHQKLSEEGLQPDSIYSMLNRRNYQIQTQGGTLYLELAYPALDGSIGVLRGRRTAFAGNSVGEILDLEEFFRHLIGSFGTDYFGGPSFYAKFMVDPDFPDHWMHHVSQVLAEQPYSESFALPHLIRKYSSRDLLNALIPVSRSDGTTTLNVVEPPLDAFLTAQLLPIIYRISPEHDWELPVHRYDLPPLLNPV